ncbi:MAG: ComEC/Rec2 family competence protein [Bacteroidota bacterium]|nr:ComEC/Rec2 family competence protein [Bacteroidota bacterium]
MKSWKNFPFLRLIIPSFSGILTGYFVPFIHLPFTLILFILLFSFLIVRYSGKFFSYRYRWIPGLLLMVFLGFFFAIISLLSLDTSDNEMITQLGNADRYYIADISEPPVQKARSVKIIVDIKAVKSDDQWFLVGRKALLYVYKDLHAKDLYYGKRILFRGKLGQPDKARNPGDFDYRKYLALRNIFLRGYISGPHWIMLPAEKGNPLFRGAMKTRDKLLGIFRSNGMTGREFAVASALLLGFVDEIDQQTLKEYSATGAMHILSVSGMHVGIIFLVLDKMFSPLARKSWGSIVKAPLIILMIWFYAFITGLSPAVLRASAMLSMVVLGQSLKREPEILNILAASAVSLLAWNPFLIFDAGFQLSYLAVAGIVLINKPVYDLYVTSNYLLDKVWALLAVSISAQLATFPLGFFYFHQFPNLFMITNLVVVPLSSLIIYMGILLLFLGSVPVVSVILAKCLIFLVKLLNFSIHFIEGIPGSVSRGITISLPETLLIYMIVIWFIVFLMTKRKPWLFACLFSTACLLTLCTADKYSRLKEKGVVIYHLGRSSAMEVQYHGESIYMDWGSKAIDPSLTESLERNRLNAGITKKLSMHLNPSGREGKSFQWRFCLFRRGCFVQAGRKRFAIVSGRLPRKPGKAVIVDYLILTENPDIRLSELLKHFLSTEVIIDPSVPKWKAKKLESEAKMLKIRCHNIANSGAKVIQY